MEIKTTRVTYRILSHTRSIRPGYKAIQKTHCITARSHHFWDEAPQSTTHCSGVSTHRSSVQGINGEQGHKGSAVQMQYDYSFPPRDDIWFHIPRSFVLFLTLLVLLCHFTNVTAQAHQSLSVLGRKTSMASSHKHSE